MSKPIKKFFTQKTIATKITQAQQLVISLLRFRTALGLPKKALPFYILNAIFKVFPLF